MTALRKSYEDAVLAALEPLLLPGLGGAAGGYLKTAEAYAGPLEPAEDDPALLRLIDAGTPAIGVTLGDGSYEGITLRRRRADLRLTLEVLVVSGNLAGDVARERGDGLDADPGIYQIIEDVREKIFGVELGVDGAGFAAPSDERAVLRAPALTVWRLSYALVFDVWQGDPEESDSEYTSRQDRYNNPEDDTADPIITANTSYDGEDAGPGVPASPYQTRLAFPWTAPSTAESYVITISTRLSTDYVVPEPGILSLPDADDAAPSFRITLKTTTSFTLLCSYPLPAGAVLDFVVWDLDQE